MGEPDAWKDWWTRPEAKSFYFIGKDNIFFHAAWWPAQLMGTGEQFMELFAEESGKRLTLPYDVPANMFMNLKEKRISGSRNWGVWGRDFLTRYDPDPLRYYLTVNMPEMRDTDWDWEDFYSRNNDELVATWGNLANRVLSFAYKHWQGVVPEPGELSSLDQQLLATVESGFETIGREIEAIHLRAALGEAMRLASEVNRYLDQTAPWTSIKTDKAAAARSIYTALRAIDSLKILFAPFLPFSSERLQVFFAYPQPIFGETHIETVRDSLGEHTVLRYQPGQASGRWAPSQLKPGAALNPPEPLFRKLDVSIVEAERARLGKPLA
jgi:methionyl-tRNA synthetase